MKVAHRVLPAVAAILGFACAAWAAHPFSFEDMARARRLSSFDVSPDGRSVAYAATSVDLGDDTTTSAIWLAPTDGGPARQLTEGARHDTEPRFSPDGKTLAFVSDRGGTPQIYLLNMAGGEARPLTKISTGAGGISWSPDGKFLLFVSDVFPDCGDDACNQARNEQMEKTKVTGRVIERLLFRHWSTWKDGRRTHIFRVDVSGGATKDLTPGDHDAPPFSLGGPQDYDVSPDGRFVVYNSNHDAVEAISTNGDLWEVPSGGGEARCLTCENKAYDGSPRYSPDGRFIAYRSQKTPGYESDKFDLKVLDRETGRIRTLTEAFDDWVEDFAWSADSKTIDFVSTVRGRDPIFEVAAKGGPIREVVSGVTAGDPHVLRGGAIVFSRVSLTRPAEVWEYEGETANRKPRSGAERLRQVTHLNDALFADCEMGKVLERWYPAADGRKIQAWVILPPGFDEHRHYPGLFWIHGGPQGAWEDGWSYRWNPEVLASAGYVLYMPNPRGSTGYGQKFVAEISGDWGGKVFDDLMRGADDFESLPYVEKGNVGAAGASFGGFMIDWIEGHTDRFKALFCHDGISDQESMYATEELWFPEWEFKGQPSNSPLYRKWSPMESAANFKTPELIVHGEQDFRVPYTQGLLMFTLLQRRGIPSKLIVFSKENHFVLRAQDSRLWYNEMIDWFHHYLGGAPADPKALESAYSVTR